jgi:hypothetical protein
LGGDFVRADASTGSECHARNRRDYTR